MRASEVATGELSTLALAALTCTEVFRSAKAQSINIFCLVIEVRGPQSYLAGKVIPVHIIHAKVTALGKGTTVFDSMLDTMSLQPSRHRIA